MRGLKSKGKGGSKERAQERELKRKLKSDLNKAFKGHSLRESESCPVGACLIREA